MRFKKRFLFGLLVIVAGALLPGQAAAAAPVSLVGWGLDSPRGIAFYHDRLAVAEAGHGGSDCHFIPNGPPFPFCIGNSSQISWVDKSNPGVPNPFVTGLFSVSAGPEGTLGASGLSVRDGRLYAIIGSTPQETFGNPLGAQEAGHLISVNPNNGKFKSVASVGESDFNYTTQFTEPTPGVYSPGTQEHDANPSDVLATGHGFLVADSGANTLSSVSKDGDVTVLQHFEWRDPNPNNFPSDDVPTCVTSSDEALWVGTLAGHLYRVGEDGVTQVVPKDGAGNGLLTHVTGCTSDGEGNLYLVNMFGPGIPFTSPSFFQGNVVKYSSESGKGSVLASSSANPILLLPYMPTIGPDGNLYVTAGAICPANGSSPFPPGAPNPCMAGGKPGGKVVKINLPQNDQGD
jgi:hypothetical protein